MVEAFEEICAQFIMETERVTINKMKRLSNHRLPAQTAYARGEVERPKPNPLNDQRTAEEAELKALLAKFQVRSCSWEDSGCVLWLRICTGGGEEVGERVRGVDQSER